MFFFLHINILVRSKVFKTAFISFTEFQLTPTEFKLVEQNLPFFTIFVF